MLSLDLLIQSFGETTPIKLIMSSPRQCPTYMQHRHPLQIDRSPSVDVVILLYLGFAGLGLLEFGILSFSCWSCGFRARDTETLVSYFCARCWEWLSINDAMANYIWLNRGNLYSPRTLLFELCLCIHFYISPPRLQCVEHIIIGSTALVPAHFPLILLIGSCISGWDKSIERQNLQRKQSIIVQPSFLVLSNLHFHAIGIQFHPPLRLCGPKRRCPCISETQVTEPPRSTPRTAAALVGMKHSGQ